MAVLAISSIIGGAVLGIRFNVLILVPAIILTCLILLVLGPALSNSFSSLLANIGVAISGLQVGYLIGVLLRHTKHLRMFRTWGRNGAVSGPTSS